MPHLQERVLVRAWRHRNESGRIHYLAAYADGKERHLYVDEGSALYAVPTVISWPKGYTGPASGDEPEQ